MSSPIAFFGATGGSGVACLTLALKNNHECYALVRNEAKLQNLLKSRNISDSDLTHLTIITGDIKDIESVTKTLAPASKKPAQSIISCVGMAPKFKPDPRTFFLDLQDLNICQVGMKTILDACRTIYSSSSSQKPSITCISSTGISDGKRDIPIAYIPFYRVLLAAPHADKKKMENLVIAEEKLPEGQKGISGILILRPSFFVDGPSRGMEKVRVGSEEKPEIGYTITREDVGLSLYEMAVKKVVGEGVELACVTY